MRQVSEGVTQLNAVSVNNHFLSLDRAAGLADKLASIKAATAAINDDISEDDADAVKEIIGDWMRSKFPDPASWEAGTS